MSIIHHGKNTQVESNNEHSSQYAFLNILDEYAYIGVWGTSWKQPTILIIGEYDFELLSFDSEAYYDDWKMHHTPVSKKEKIIRIGKKNN